jgi:hypothetical protein
MTHQAGQLEGVRLEDAGPAELKNVSHPLRLWRAEAS